MPCSPDADAHSKDITARPPITEPPPWVHANHARTRTSQATPYGLSYASAYDLVHRGGKPDDVAVVCAIVWE